MSFTRNFGVVISIITILGLLTACNETPLSSKDQLQQGISKSPNDNREYSSLTLDNKLRVILISDPNTDKSAAALDVFTGSMSDPKERLGLAHFLEHMLFLGTEKYPESSEYQTFIKTHGGSHNAYTSPEHTNYFFDIDPTQLEPALDRFAQFFVAPLLDDKYVDREKNAVHSEYEMRKKDEGRRVQAVKKQLLNPDHPYSQFAIGSLDTLADTESSSTKDKLIQFYNTHYSANIMTVVILGKEPLETLKELAVDKFSNIKNQEATPLTTEAPIYTENSLPKQLHISPLKDTRLLTITYPVPPVHRYYLTKPHHYISNLIGHEGPGSLLSALKEKGWCDALSAGMGVNHEDFATFEIKMSLTEAGLENTDHIIALFYEYVDLLKREGIQQWIFDEQKQIAEIHFNFQEKSPPMSYVSTLARRAQLYPLQDVLSAPYVMSKFDSKIIRNYLDKIIPENSLVTLIAKNVETDKEESFFNTPYKVESVSPESLVSWKTQTLEHNLHLPAPNKFIPENLALRELEPDSTTPILVTKNSSLSIWSKQDHDFLIPRTGIFINLESKNTYTSPKNAVLTKLFARQINEQLNEFGYPAYLAGLNYGISMTREGLLVSISGYSDKQDTLLKEILHAIKKPAFNKNMLSIFKDELKRSWSNRSKDKPFEQTLREATQLLLDPFWTEQEQISALEKITLSDLESFYTVLLDDLKIRMLCHGNITEKECSNLSKTVNTALLEQATTHEGAPERLLVKLSDEQKVSRKLEIDHNDSAINYYFQSKNQDMTNRAMFSILAHTIQPVFYNKLRTELQLGYAVFSSPMEYLRTPGIGFILQSPVAEPSELLFHISSFLKEFEQQLKEMDSEEFEKQKEGLLTKVLEEHKNLKERSYSYWGQIMNRYYQFDAKDKLAEKIKLISKDEFIAFYQDNITASNTGTLITYAVGNEKQDSFPSKPWEQDEIPSHAAFKAEGSSFSLHPFSL